MIFLGNLVKVSDTKFSVGLTHYAPFDEKDGLGKNEQELKAEGLLVESLPTPNPPSEAMIPLLFANPETGETWFEYQERPWTLQEQQAQKIIQLEQQLRITQEAVDALLMG
ncbi:hypothetical protein AV540_00060 [Brevibacillus parabrevis]|uniref:hypothetical protein n=1 Tax=Brevibacillus parabrevis TaxID=54914 RepID=UPI0007AB8FEA|nr:hypothetical protein [Brevibacillus parabrevis]KZE55782.1 hypothetical protein AV540_00060 [Brevibacillus parabrevis]